jgi:hypothetical protein
VSRHMRRDTVHRCIDILLFFLPFSHSLEASFLFFYIFSSTVFPIWAIAWLWSTSISLPTSSPATSPAPSARATTSPSSEFLHVCLASSPAPDRRVLGNYLLVLEIERNGVPARNSKCEHEFPISCRSFPLGRRKAKHCH